MELLLWSVNSAKSKEKSHDTISLAFVPLSFKSGNQDGFPLQFPRSPWGAVV